MVVRNVVEVYADTTSQTLQLVMDDGREVNIKVGLCKVGLDVVNHLVYLYEASESQLARGEFVFEPNYYSLNFNTITTPAEANEIDLRDTILGYLADASGVGGATAANQVLEIAKLQEISDRLIYSGNGNSVGFYAFNTYQQVTNLIAMRRMQNCQEILITDATRAGLQTKIQTELTTNHPAYYLIEKSIFANSTDTEFTAFLTISVF